jgi:hypothetical protein
MKIPRPPAFDRHDLINFQADHFALSLEAAICMLLQFVKRCVRTEKNSRCNKPIKILRDYCIS